MIATALIGSARASSFMVKEVGGLRTALLLLCVPKMRPGDWECPECGAAPNFASRYECFKCGAPRPGGAAQQNERWPSSSQRATMKPGDWECPECGASPVFASRSSCFRCGAPKPAGSGSALDARKDPEGPEFRDNFQGTRCFVENLSFDTDWQSLKDAFSYEGYPIVYASVSTHRDTGRSKGHGIVQFETAHAAEHAIAEMTGYELDGRFINVRPDFQERQRRDGTSAGRGEGARGKAKSESWMNREWSRVEGTGDGTDDANVVEGEVNELLSKRDGAREARDFEVADGLLEDLERMGVYVDDARRQRVWWVGRRADGQESRRGSRAARGRRDWYSGGSGDGFDDGGW